MTLKAAMVLFCALTVVVAGEATQVDPTEKVAGNLVKVDDAPMMSVFIHAPVASNLR